MKAPRIGDTVAYLHAYSGTVDGPWRILRVLSAVSGPAWYVKAEPVDPEPGEEGHMIGRVFA